MKIGISVCFALINSVLWNLLCVWCVAVFNANDVKTMLEALMLTKHQPEEITLWQQPTDADVQLEPSLWP